MIVVGLLVAFAAAQSCSGVADTSCLCVPQLADATGDWFVIFFFENFLVLIKTARAQLQ